ncbi:MAG: hypothetical protein FWC41_00585 [Firmicutes bacterium]|nr:hypothetical protein [Bacillota bacterium]
MNNEIILIAKHTTNDEPAFYANIIGSYKNIDGYLSMKDKAIENFLDGREESYIIKAYKLIPNEGYIAKNIIEMRLKIKRLKDDKINDQNF